MLERLKAGCTRILILLVEHPRDLAIHGDSTVNEIFGALTM